MKREATMLRHVPETRWRKLFQMLFLPLGAAVNMVLGLAVLSGLRPDDEFGWLQLGTGALCFMIAGWLAGSMWSSRYWSRNLNRQVTTWRTIADAIFGWLEDAPLPADSVRNLQSTLDKVVPRAAER